MTTRTTVLALVAALVSSLAGCVPVGELDQTVLNRYQEVMADRGMTQPRPDDGGKSLSLLRPSPKQNVGGELVLTVDPVTGRTKVMLTLEQAILRALANNLDIRVVSYDPAISRQEIIKAAAAFDYTLFGSANEAHSDNNINNFGGGGVNRVTTYQAGVKQLTVTGAQQQLAYTMTRTWDDSTARIFEPAWQQQLGYQVTQPLLRDAWPDFNLSALHIAEVSEKSSRQAFRQKVEEIVATVITGYWQMWEAQEELKVEQWLLKQAGTTSDKVKGRADLDATKVQTMQAEAAVKTREILVLQAELACKNAMNQLSQLLADKQINLLTNYELVAATDPDTTLVKLDITDQLLTALQHSPLLEQARLAIQVSDINVNVAMNQELPRLDLVASTGIQGLSGKQGDSIQNLFTGEFLSYSFGLQLEYPIGNRARLADTQKRRLERLKAIVQMQSAADQVALAIRQTIDQVEFRHQVILKSQEVINADQAQLQALEDTEQIRGRLTPEFLQLKLNAQTQLANDQQTRFQAIQAYNAALATLAQITGTILELNRVRIAMPVAIGDAPSLPQAEPTTGAATTPATTPGYPR